MGKHGGHFLHTLSTSPHRPDGNAFPFPSGPSPWGEGFAVLQGSEAIGSLTGPCLRQQHTSLRTSLIRPSSAPYMPPPFSPFRPPELAGRSLSVPSLCCSYFSEITFLFLPQCFRSWLSGNQGRTRTSPPRCHSAPSLLYSCGFPALTSVCPSVLEAP